MTPSSTITKASVIEVSLVVTLCVSIAAGSAWATRITVGMEALRKRAAEDSLEHRLALEELSETVKRGTGDRWTRSDMEVWVMQANREVEIWSMTAEQEMGLPIGTWHRFKFPKPSDVKR